MGQLNVLNVGAGDIKVVFNEGDEAETSKAIKMLKDMQARGYLIAVELPDGTYTRAVDIDATRNRYIITVPDEMPLPPQAELVAEPRRRGRRRKASVPVTGARAVGVARSAGG